MSGYTKTTEMGFTYLERHRVVMDIKRRYTHQCLFIVNIGHSTANHAV